MDTYYIARFEEGRLVSLSAAMDRALALDIYEPCGHADAYEIVVGAAEAVELLRRKGKR